MDLNAEVLTTAEAARFIKFSERHLEQLRAEKRGPSFSRLPGGKIRYLRIDLLNWLKTFSVLPHEANQAQPVEVEWIDLRTSNPRKTSRSWQASEVAKACVCSNGLLFEVSIFCDPESQHLDIGPIRLATGSEDLWSSIENAAIDEYERVRKITTK